MSWSKYPKMAESTQAWASLPPGDWVVTEKIHGANFSVVADAEGGTHFAKRSGPLPADEDFYSFRSAGLDATLAAAAHRLLEAVRLAAPATRSVCVFGELFGGHYPHPAVPPTPGLQPVQRGVWYCPDLRFVAFDVCASVGGGGGGGGEAAAAAAAAERCFLDFAEARRLARRAGFWFAEPLAQGPLERCLEEPVRFSVVGPRVDRAACTPPPLPPRPPPSARTSPTSASRACASTSSPSSTSSCRLRCASARACLPCSACRRWPSKG